MEQNTLETALAHGKEMLSVFGGEHKEFIEVAIDCIDKALSQPEIIHCCECKHRVKQCDGSYACEVNFSETGYWLEKQNDDFCSWGERRTDETD